MRVTTRRVRPRTLSQYSRNCATDRISMQTPLDTGGRWLGPVTELPQLATPLLPPGSRQCANDPGLERFRILEHILRNGVVLHDFTFHSHWPKRFHLSGNEVRTIGVVHLEIDRVIGNQREEQLAAVDPYATEHGSTADAGRRARELVEDEASEAGANAHDLPHPIVYR